MVRHEVERPEVVGHLHALQQRTAHRHHAHALFAQGAGVVHGERVSLNGTRMSREQNLVVFHPCFAAHLVGYSCLVFLPDALVGFFFFLKHGCKGTKELRVKS